MDLTFNLSQRAKGVLWYLQFILCCWKSYSLRGMLNSSVLGKKHCLSLQAW
jgi:hypothetical protein